MRLRPGCMRRAKMPLRNPTKKTCYVYTNKCPFIRHGKLNFCSRRPERISREGTQSSSRGGLRPEARPPALVARSRLCTRVRAPTPTPPPDTGRTPHRGTRRGTQPSAARGHSPTAANTTPGTSGGRWWRTLSSVGPHSTMEDTCLAMAGNLHQCTVAQQWAFKGHKP